MSTSKIFRKVFTVFIVISCLLCTSCSTEDILPAAIIEVDSTNLSEDNGSVVLTVTLNGLASNNISLPISFSGTATDLDYTPSATSISITKGLKSGSITISSKQDQLVEGIETIVVNIGNNQDLLILGNQEISIDLLDDDSDTDNDGVLDANDKCPNTPGDINNDGCPFLGFLINEVLYDPASGLAGDANGDGIRDANEDEFIEFFNSGPAIDLTGYTLEDESRIRHTFPAGSIIPLNGVLIVFGGGNPNTSNFGGAIVQTASEGLLNMTNSGDIITMRDPNGAVYLTFDIYPLSNNPDEAYTRNPDLTGNFEQHAGISSANGVLFSPGTKLDGSSF